MYIKISICINKAPHQGNFNSSSHMTWESLLANEAIYMRASRRNPGTGMFAKDYKTLGEHGAFNKFAMKLSSNTTERISIYFKCSTDDVYNLLSSFFKHFYCFVDEDFIIYIFVDCYEHSRLSIWNQQSYTFPTQIHKAFWAPSTERVSKSWNYSSTLFCIDYILSIESS